MAETSLLAGNRLRSWKRINWSTMNSAVQGVLDRLGVHLNVSTLARGLSVADQQIVEIAKALSFNARVIVMDEPTAALSNAEVDRLFEVIATLRAEGAAVLFISHRLDDVFSTCQRVTVMRDGRFVTSDLIEQYDGRDHHQGDGRPGHQHPVPRKPTERPVLRY